MPKDNRYTITNEQGGPQVVTFNQVQQVNDGFNGNSAYCRELMDAIGFIDSEPECTRFVTGGGINIEPLRGE